MELSFDDFKKRAKDSQLSKWEKIGFPDTYRKETEVSIFRDIVEKLNLDDQKTNNILDVGCGCSGLVELLINYSVKEEKNLSLIDSEEMLSNIDTEIKIDYPNIHLMPGYFPDVEMNDTTNTGKFNAILVYSVIQYPFLEGNIYKFIHRCIELLAEGGRLLIGDIPNFSKRERFLASKQGKAFLSQNVEISTNILTDHEQFERIDDSIIFSILQRFRNFGCETYLLSQSPELPFANRREDILIVKR
jgi:cyclopropane fatty-acyl-phospholipid synthase-like methyltransferase